MSCEDDFGEERMWETKDGTEIAYHDLEDSHLLNIVAMKQRNSRAINAGLMTVTGEQAGYALEDERNRNEQEIDDLLDECDRRGWTREYALGGWRSE